MGLRKFLICAYANHCIVFVQLLTPYHLIIIMMILLILILLLIIIIMTYHNERGKRVGVRAGAAGACGAPGHAPAGIPHLSDCWWL